MLLNALMIDFKTHGVLDYGVAAVSSAFPKLLNLEEALEPPTSMRKVPQRR